MEAPGHTGNMAELRPNPALIVESDAPIGDCIRRMRVHGTGSVLVVAGTFPHDLVGIFTERDLLKWIDEIQHGGYWDKPIATLMTKPVRTLSIYDIEKAPRIMIEAGIRHLPVVYDNENGVRGIAGVVSIKDLMKRLSELLEKQPDDAPTSKAITVVALDEKKRKGLHTLLSQGGRMTVTELGEHALKNLGDLSDRRTTGIAAVDLDGYPVDEWLTCLKSASAHPDGPSFLLIHSAGAIAPKNLEFIKDLAKSERFAVLPRPLAALDVLHRVRVWLGSRKRLA
jgi:CBS domain-containing protein